MASTSRPAAADNAATAPAIAVDDLQKRYGEVISILGASGSGKSTFLRCLNLLELPSVGRLQIFGEEVNLRQSGDSLHISDRKQVDRLRTQVAMVFQNFCLWSHMTVLENLMEAPVHVQRRSRGEVRDEAEAMLRRVGMIDRAKAYPASCPAASSKEPPSPAPWS